MANKGIQPRLEALTAGIARQIIDLSNSYQRAERFDLALPGYQFVLLNGDRGSQEHVIRQMLKKENCLDPTECFPKLDRTTQDLLLDTMWELWGSKIFDVNRPKLTVPKMFFELRTKEEWGDRFAPYCWETHNITPMQETWEPPTLPIPSARVTGCRIELYTSPVPERVPQPQFSPWFMPNYWAFWDDDFHCFLRKERTQTEDVFPELKEGTVYDPRKLIILFRDMYDKLKK